VFCTNPASEGFRPTGDGDQSLTARWSYGEKNPSQAARRKNISIWKLQGKPGIMVVNFGKAKKPFF
jgi:hypothetical protein